MMRTSNPALGKRIESLSFSSEQSEKMTITGTIQKSAIMLFLLVAAGSISWRAFLGGMAWVGPAVGVSAILGFIIAMITIFKPGISHITAPLYAVAEGVFLGAISAMYNSLYNGIVFQAFMLTTVTLGIMLILYRSGVLRATPKFRRGIFIATSAVLVVYLLQWILSIFGGNGFPMINGSGMLGILFSVVVVGIAALNLIMDFDMIEQSTANGMSKKYEWYGAFALMITLVWLYLEILRLLSKLRR
jgi:uncharacterized YccA/Bax inhibitor family protein